MHLSLYFHHYRWAVGIVLNLKKITLYKHLIIILLTKFSFNYFSPLAVTKLTMNIQQIEIKASKPITKPSKLNFIYFWV